MHSDQIAEICCSLKSCHYNMVKYTSWRFCLQSLFTDTLRIYMSRSLFRLSQHRGLLPRSENRKKSRTLLTVEDHAWKLDLYGAPSAPITVLIHVTINAIAALGTYTAPIASKGVQNRQLSVRRKTFWTHTLHRK